MLQDRRVNVLWALNEIYVTRSQPVGAIRLEPWPERAGSADGPRASFASFRQRVQSVVGQDPRLNQVASFRVSRPASEVGGDDHDGAMVELRWASVEDEARGRAAPYLDTRRFGE